MVDGLAEGHAHDVRLALERDDDVRAGVVRVDRGRRRRREDVAKVKVPDRVSRVDVVPGQQKGVNFSTLKPHISVSFHSLQLIFGRVIISLQVLEGWMLFLTHSIAKHSS